MVSIIVFIMIINSGSFLAAVKGKGRFEEFLPITNMLAIFLLYVCGMFGGLKYGVFLIGIIAIGLYGYAGRFLCTENGRDAFKKNFLTPAFFVYLVLFLMLLAGTWGIQANSWDEFTHWMDSVKVMSYLDDFVTNPKSNSAFKSYPPAMSLFQYLLQKLHMFLKSTNEFNEWKMCFAYQIFAYSAIGPLLSRLDFKKPLLCLLSFCVMVVSPLYFYPSMLTETCIDPFVGILCGGAIAYLFCCTKRNIFFYVYEALLCFTLVLAKDIGLFFAMFVSAGIVFDSLFRRQELKKWFLVLLPALLTVLAKFSWHLEVVCTEGVTQSFPSSGINYIEYSRIFFLGEEKGYFREIAEGIKERFFQRNFYIPNLDIGISYFIFVLMDVALLFFACYLMKKDGGISKNRAMVIGLVAVMLVFYSYGLGAVYCYNFSQYEAVRFASYGRYMNMPFLAAWLAVQFGLLYGIDACGERRSLILSLMALEVAFHFSPKEYLYDFVDNEWAVRSQGMRSAYEDISGQILKSCNGEDRIYFISQEDSGLNWWIVRFRVRPNNIANDWSSWSIGIPFYADDIYTYQISPEEWWEILDSRFDYVALFRVNDYFVENYGCFFRNPDEIKGNRLFRIDHEAGDLEVVEND